MVGVVEVWAGHPAQRKESDVKHIALFHSFPGVVIAAGPLPGFPAVSHLHMASHYSTVPTAAPTRGAPV